MTVPVPRLASLDGRIYATDEATIPVTDEGLLRGDGVFEVFRVYCGVPFQLGEHLARMERSSAALRLPLPTQSLMEEIEALMALASGATYDLRVVLTRAGRRILLLEEPLDVGDTLRLALVPYTPSELLAGVKSLSYAAHMLATRVARERGFDEALFVTANGRVLEAPTATLFWASDDGVLRTPPLSEPILASVTRSAVLRGVEVVETVCRVDDLLSCREAFLASTVREVQGVDAVEQHQLEAPGSLTCAAADAFRAEVDGAVAAARPTSHEGTAAVSVGLEQQEVQT